MDRTAVDAVRRFNRTVTQWVGALERDYLGRGRPLGASRVLWEIGTDGRRVRDLRAALNLDSGYLSRMLRSLEHQGLAVTEPDGGNGRVRTARLTPAGAAERRLLDERSDSLAWSLVEPLDAGRRDRLLPAMTTGRQPLPAGPVDLRGEHPESAGAPWGIGADFATPPARV